MFASILLAEIGAGALVVAGVAVIVIVFFIFFGIWASRYTKVGPNQVLGHLGKEASVR